jgi:DMSO reductase family type II enzyme chaperone
VHQFLARAFDYPAEEAWAWLTNPEIQDALALAVTALEPDRPGPLRAAQETLARAFVPAGFEAFHDGYITAIGHAARGSCPVNEIEYGDLKADPLFQPHRLADLAAFYRAFGLEVGPGSDERLDHLSVELEFMGVLAAQEANLLNSDAGADALAVCREAQHKFLREHLGRWTPAFARRLQRAVGQGPLGALAGFALAFIEPECRGAGVTPGSEDLLLRPADEAASLCDGCGLPSLPPGAATAA